MIFYEFTQSQYTVEEGSGQILVSNELSLNNSRAIPLVQVLVFTSDESAQGISLYKLCSIIESVQ